jgi:hypothetical protein
MTRSAKILSRSLCLGAVAMVALAGLAIPQTQARPLPANGPYGVLCTCGDLTVTSSDIFGNVAIGDGGAFIGSTADGPGTVTGTVEFAAPNTGQFLPDGIVVTGGATFGNANVQTDISNLNMTSQMLSSEPGFTQTISGGGSVNASSGTLDSAGNRVFTATIGSFPAGTTFTINGDGTGTQTVVFNIGGTGALSFDGSMVLTGGLTPDQVLFNFDGGDFETNSGGPDLTIDTTPFAEPSILLAAATPPNAQTTTGTFFDPNGSIGVLDSIIDGRVFGAPTDFTITDSTIVSPASSVPEPASLTLLGAGLVGFGIIRRRHRLFARP